MRSVMSDILDIGGDADDGVRRLTGGAVRVAPGRVRAAFLDEAAGERMDEEAVVCAACMTVCDAPPVRLLLTMSPTARDRMAEAMTGGGPVDEALADSAVQELCNIFGSALANRIARLRGEAVRTSPPETRRDMAGAVFAGMLAVMPDAGDTIWLLDAGLHLEDEDLDCAVHIFLGDPTAWERAVVSADRNIEPQGTREEHTCPES